jgi:hypothetical protein
MNTTPHRLRTRVAGMAMAAWAVSPLPALALDPSVQTGLEVTGTVDLDSFGPLPPLSAQQQSVVTLPLPVSQLLIADSSPGVFSYSSSADIGLLQLKVFGSLSNSAASPLGNGETAVMQVRSEVRDVLTLSAATADPYIVSFELDVDGAVTGSGQALANAFLDFGVLGGAHGTDSGAYSFGLINDTLIVSRQVSGTTVDVDFTAWLNFSVTRVNAGSTVTGALDNTATMRLVLPAGVTLSNSASGTFGVPIPAIPEPATWALWLAGLAMMGWLGQRRGAGPERSAAAAAAAA